MFYIHPHSCSQQFKNRVAWADWQNLSYRHLCWNNDQHMKVVFIKQLIMVLFFIYFILKKKINTIITAITTATTTKKQNKLKVLQSTLLPSFLPRDLLILKHNLSAIPGTSHDKETCMYETSDLNNLEKNRINYRILFSLAPANTTLIPNRPDEQLPVPMNCLSQCLIYKWDLRLKSKAGSLSFPGHFVYINCTKPYGLPKCLIFLWTLLGWVASFCPSNFLQQQVLQSDYSLCQQAW